MALMMITNDDHWMILTGLLTNLSSNYSFTIRSSCKVYVFKPLVSYIIIYNQKDVIRASSGLRFMVTHWDPAGNRT